MKSRERKREGSSWASRSTFSLSSFFFPFFLLLVSLAWPSVARAHGGGPYPILLEQAVATYTVSVLADPDVGIGTFIVQATLTGGEPLPAHTVVTVWTQPEDGHVAEAGYRAQRQTTRAGEEFIAKVPFDAEGMWQVRLVLDGPAGRGETAFNVRVTPPGPGWVGTLLCFIPFIALGALWLVSALRQGQA